MAIVQVSRITNRQGLTENLPQLAGAEFGWCVDSRRLFIGNGTLQEGAPVIGNTEVLTEFSDITSTATYIYKDTAVGYTAQTGPTAGDPVVRTVQQKLDDFADVRDFGAVGDGTTDDTDAINRALYQLYCRDNNPLVRRTLYFPAGTYLVSSPIVIPTYAKLVGEGANCSIIQLDSLSPTYVAQYGDSNQRTGVNIGIAGGIAPRNIEISSMTFQSPDESDIFLVEDAEQCYFDSVNFIGPYTTNSISTTPGDIAGVRFASTPTYVTNTVTFDKCLFYGTTYGINTDEQIQGVTVSNCRFDTLYQGVALGVGTPVDGGPTGVRVVHNLFDNIYAEGIIYDDVNLNITAYNAFYDVANEYTGNPQRPVVSFGNDNNASFNDMFARTNADATTIPRVYILGSPSINESAWQTKTATQLQLGRYARETGLTFTLGNNGSTQAMFTVNSIYVKAFKVDYTMKQGEYLRNGTLTVVGKIASGADSTLSYTDDYTENYNLGITLIPSQSGTTITIGYTNSGASTELTYSISHLA